MKKTKGLWLGVLIFCLMGFANSTLAEQDFKVSDDDIEDFVDYLLCDFDVSISETDLEAALNGLISPEDTACNPIDAELTSMTATSAYFEWLPSAGAINYTVASIGLTNGVVFEDTTSIAKYNFTGLTPQKYLFVFITNCVNGSSIADIVIIDMDVYYPNQNYSLLDYCRCRPGTPSFSPESSCSSFYTMEETYAWNNGDCQARKYRFALNDLDSENYDSEIWIFNNTVSSIVNLSAMSCSDYIIEESGLDGFTVSDPGNFEAIVESDGIHFYIENTSINITATKCGCYDNIIQAREVNSKTFEETTSFSITPNPFTDHFVINAPIQTDGFGIISIIAMDGHVLSTQKVSVDKGTESIEVNAANLPAGVYSILFESNNEQFIERIVKI